ncbi:hypothetical protein [Saccharicrinis aurantiacus]|uniref:hypothetical protein n=1 Tax=Saccharicrinis aurantiacus TaxID=1849719 RepID=UPI0015C56D14|nr:hypothetical protein [Saccharicrinis aurantiacus]
MKRNILETVFDWIAYVSMIVIFPIIAISGPFVYADSFKEDFWGHIIGIILSIWLSIHIIIGINKSSKLTFVKGLCVTENKEDVLEIIYQNSWTLHQKNKDSYIIAPEGIKTQLNIIFNKEGILVNVISFGKGDMISPFRQLARRNYINTIKDYFEKKYALQ